jgi:fluoride exporter
MVRARRLGPVPSSNVKGHGRILAVISAGGVIGALARYGIGRAMPTSAGGFPWSTFLINVVGCFLIGVLMVIVIHAIPNQTLVRPFVGVGILGGFTTFSTYAVETARLLDAGAAATGIAYLFGTLLTAMTALYAGTAGTRLALFRLTHHGERA